MKTYLFPIEFIEEDDGRWSVYVPELTAEGATSWGRTRDEALSNIQEVMQMLIEEWLEDGKPLPAAIQVSDRPTAAISV